MDANKLEKLKEIGYQIKKTCALCKHSKFVKGSSFGDCSVFTYDHLKHQSTKPLSVNVNGSCPKWEMKIVHDLHAFEQLIEDAD